MSVSGPGSVTNYPSRLTQADVLAIDVARELLADYFVRPGDNPVIQALDLLDTIYNNTQDPIAKAWLARNYNYLLGLAEKDGLVRIPTSGRSTPALRTSPSASTAPSALGTSPTQSNKPSLAQMRARETALSLARRELGEHFFRSGNPNRDNSVRAALDKLEKEMSRVDAPVSRRQQLLDRFIALKDAACAAGWLCQKDQLSQGGSMMQPSAPSAQGPTGAG